MIRSAPSISTTGAAGRLERGGSRAAGRPRARRAAARRARGRGPSRRRRWRSPYRVRSVVGGRAVPSASAGPAGSSSSSRTACTLPPGLGAPAASRAPAVPQPALQRVLQARRRAAVPRRAATAASSAASARSTTTPSTRFHDNRWGMFGFLELEDDPEVLPRAARGRRRRGCAQHGRDHMIGPMDFTINDESGVHDRGLRARADDQAALAPALLPAALRGGRARQGDGPADVGARDLRPREDAADHLQARRAGRAAPRHHASARCRGARCGATWTASPRSTTRPGARTGASRRTRRRDLDAYAQEMQLVFDPHWFMVAETAGGRDGRRSRSRCPTSTRCSRR